MDVSAISSAFASSTFISSSGSAQIEARIQALEAQIAQLQADSATNDAAAQARIQSLQAQVRNLQAQFERARRSEAGSVAVTTTSTFTETPGSVESFFPSDSLVGRYLNAVA